MGSRLESKDGFEKYITYADENAYLDYGHLVA